MARLMNFINQPGASSPLVQPSPVGIGGLGMAGPAGKGGYGGPGTVSEPNLFESLGTGLALAYDPRYSRRYRSGIGGVTHGLALGTQLHRETQQQNASLGMEWQKLQAQIAESRARRARFQWDMDQERLSRNQVAKERQNRRAMLEQDETLTPEAREVLASGGTAYEKYVADRFATPTSRVKWGQPEQMNVGGRQIWAQRSSEGQIKVLSNQAQGESPEALLGRQQAVSAALMADENLTSEQKTAILKNQDVWDNYLENVISEAGDDTVGADPLGTINSQRLINDAGEHPDPRWTLQHAMEQGFRVVTATESSRLIATRKASQIVNQLQDMLLSKELRDPDDATSYKGIAWDNKPGLIGQTGERISTMYQRYVQEDPRIAEYLSFSEGTVVPLVRAMGEVGNLSQTEVQKGLNLIPRAWDPADVVDRKVSNLGEMLKSWASQGDFGGGDDDDRAKLAELLRGAQ